MLIKYDTFQEYSLDIDRLKSFYRMYIFDNLDYVFIENWMNILDFYYKNNKAAVTKTDSDYQFFQKSIIIDNNIKVYLHFDVNRAIRFLPNYEAKIIYSDSVSEDLIFEKTLYSDYHARSSAPIVIINFPISKNTEKLVIDGNHRLSSKLHDKLDIPYVYLKNEDAIRIIPQVFDSFYYRFILDFSEYKSCETIDKRQKYILNSSYLSKIVKIE